jgi:predicted transcriptional regulator
MADAYEAPVAQSLVTKIVSGYVRKNRLAPADLPGLIATVHQSLLALTKPAEPEPKRTPAVSIRRSVTPNYVVCLDCGRRAKMLRRHLRDRHGLTRDEYRARWGLPAAHPLTAPAYSEQRSTMAKQIGLGQGRAGRPRRRQAPQQPA